MPVYAQVCLHPEMLIHVLSQCCPELLLTLLASRATSEPPSSLVLSNKDYSATGSTDAFLSSRLRFTADSYGQEICLLQTEDDEVGVMMGWEHGISEPSQYRRENADCKFDER